MMTEHEHRVYDGHHQYRQHAWHKLYQYQHVLLALCQIEHVTDLHNPHNDACQHTQHAAQQRAYAHVNQFVDESRVVFVAHQEQQEHHHVWHSDRQHVDSLYGRQYVVEVDGNEGESQSVEQQEQCVEAAHDTEGDFEPHAAASGMHL